MQADLLQEARRQAEICNACRYCEGYCSVFPALHRERAFSDGDLTQLANLCHNCRGCYYACQYTQPHEFALNLPKALAEVRTDSWLNFAYPAPLARLVHRSGTMIMLVSLLGIAAMTWAIGALGPAGGTGFYAVLSHSAMVAIFIPAFLLPLISMAVSLRRYWQATGGGAVRAADIAAAVKAAAGMKNLSGGHGDGCNFEDTDRFSQARRYAHQAIMYGFFLSFGATVAGTVLHYLFAMPAPYPFWSLPKLLGVSGGVLLTLGVVWMLALKLRAERDLGDERAWGGEMGFTLLLGLTGASGLALYALGGTPALAPLLALHLGAVATLFLLMPFSKMVHGLYRMAALVRDARDRRTGKGSDG